MKKITLAILKDSDSSLEACQAEIAKQPESAFGKQTYVKKLLPRVQEQYGTADPGSLVALIMMNYLQMKPGECCFIPADGIHAYLSGDIVECMARSNNVLNVGFMPRQDRDDPDLFISTLANEPHSEKEALLPAESFNGSGSGKTKVFEPPIQEFNMLWTKLDGAGSEKVRAIDGPSVMWTTKGSGTLKSKGKVHGIKKGYIFFIGAGAETEFETNEGLEIWRAYAE